MKRIIRAGAVAVTSLLKSKAVALQVGDVAPGFIAPSTEGKIELRRIVEKGPVVLALYPADFTPG